MRMMVKRSVVIGGHKTSVSLEQPFWDVVREIAAAEAITVSAVLGRVDPARAQANLSSAVRVYVLQQSDNRLTSRARQGRFHAARTQCRRFLARLCADHDLHRSRAGLALFAIY